MNRYMRFIAALIIVFSTLTSCSKWGDGGGSDRVVILYITANNSLTTYADMNFSDLLEGYIPPSGSSDKLIVHFHNYSRTPVLLSLSKDRKGNVEQKVLATYDTDNTATAEHLGEVLSYVTGQYPGCNYGLILWSHATGWLPSGYYTNGEPEAGKQGIPMKLASCQGQAPLSFGQDQKTESEIDIKDLAEAVPCYFDYIIFDCCLMGGVEVSYELKDKAGYILSSPTEIFANGMPYKSVMSPLFKKPVREAMISVADMFYHYYADSSYPYATVSVIDCSGLDLLAASCRNVFAECGHLIQETDMEDIQGYFRFNKHYFYDLGAFVAALEPSQAVIDSFTSALGKTVIYKNATEYFISFPIKFYSGLSTYTANPENDYLDNYYRSLAWNKAVGMVMD